MNPPSVSTACHLLPEMLDDAMGHLANQGVAELLHGQGREPGTPHGPAWPVEPGSLSEALYWYRRKAGLGDAPAPAEVAASLSNLGYAWGQQRRWADAETAFRESLHLRQRHGDRAGEGQTFIDLGSLYQAQERWSDAEPALAQGLGIAREVGDRRGEANALSKLGIACAAHGQPDKAVGYLQQAIAIAREVGAVDLAKPMQKELARFSRRA